MKKRKMIISMAIVLCACIITSIIFMAQAKMQDDNVPKNTLQERVNHQLMEEIIRKDIVSIMRSHGYYIDEIRKGIIQYAGVLVKYRLSFEEKAYIMEQLSNGRDLSKLCELYYFIKNTSLSFTDIGPLYDIGQLNEFSGDYWAENAFDAYTENENTLDKTEILELLDEEIDLDDIQLANVLSRRGVKTIREIIEEKKNGKEVGEIIAELYPEISFSTECLQKVTDGFVLLEGIDIARILKCDINSVIEDGIVKETCQNEVANLLGAAHQFIQENGLEDLIDEAVIDEAKQQLPSIETDIIAKKLNAGMMVREVIALFSEE